MLFWRSGMLNEWFYGSSESSAHYFPTHLLSDYFLLSACPLLSAYFLFVSCYKHTRLTTSAYGIFFCGIEMSPGVSNAYMDSQKLNAILYEPCSYTMALLLSQMAISEHETSKHFLRGILPDPPSFTCLCMHTCTFWHPCNPHSENPSYRRNTRLSLLLGLGYLWKTVNNTHNTCNHIRQWL